MSPVDRQGGEARMRARKIVLAVLLVLVAWAVVTLLLGVALCVPEGGTC